MKTRRMIMSVSRKMQTASRHFASLFVCPSLIAVAYFSLFTLLLTLTTACEREPLELYYTGKASVIVDVDWESQFGEKPTGMTIMLAKDGDSITYTDVTNDVDRYEMELEPGTYKMLIFNLTTGEFGSMRFAKTKSYDEIYAYANQLQRTTDFWDVNVAYMREPEAIGCVTDTFTVLPEMTDGEFRFVYYKDKIPNEFEGLQLKEVVEPMTTEMYIRVKIIGFKYMAAVIGSISGMADGFLLSQQWRRQQASYHLLDNWSVVKPSATRGRAPTPPTAWTTRATRASDDSTKSVGYIATTIRTFGLPHGRELSSQRDSTSNMLSLCFTLIDNRQIVFRYPVGKYIRYRSIDIDENIGGYFSKADVTLELDLLLEAPFFPDDVIPNLPYAQPSGTGAFDAEVAPWGDDEIIDVPM
jgi:hypothetical protein